MTDRLEAAIQAVRRLPESRQTTAAELLEHLLALDEPSYMLSDEQIAEVRQGLREADAGDFATDEEVAALFPQRRK